MPNSKKTENSRRKPVNLSLRQDILEQAKALGINISSVAEIALEDAVRTARQARWLAENKQAIADHNERVQTVGMFNESLRRF